MKQLKEVKIGDLLFVDTETVRLQEDLVEGSPTYDAWEYKRGRYIEENNLDIYEDYKSEAALCADFSKLVCISVGRVKDERFVVSSYYGNDEREVLRAFMRDLTILVKKRPHIVLCGHSVKGFDIPFIMKRSVVNGIVPHRLIDVGGMKPWEVTAMDTKELWKGTGYYNSSLVSLCLALGVDSPKGDIKGSDVGNVYYSEGEKGLERIVKYCEKDVVAVANCAMKMRFEPIWENIEFEEPEEPKPEGLLERISSTGIITDKDKEEILDKASKQSADEKEATIKLIKAALAVSQKEISEELELDILMI